MLGKASQTYMKKFENQTFEFFEDADSGYLFSDLIFTKCHFVGCRFSSTQEIRLRSTAKNIQFNNCEITGGSIGAGIVEDIIIDGLKAHNHLQTFGTVFKHVAIKGEINKLMLTPYVDVFGHFPDVQKSFDVANRKYYENVDWALDISEAHFIDCDIRGIPARLIKRDEQTQVVIKREKALEGKWKEIDLSETHWKTAIEFFLADGYEDCVLLAPKQSRKFKVLLDGLNKLRDNGIAELD